jgi:hypothetical protein
MRPHDGKTWWDHLDKLPGTQEVLRRAEQCAKLTLPSLFFEEGYTTADQEDVPPEWQSYGAQLVNHLATRLMLALFAPSRPFARFDPKAGFTAAAVAAGVPEEDLRATLGLGEKEMIREVDRRAMRPKLFELIKQLLVVGPTMMVLDRDIQNIRVLGLRYFRVKRDIYGRVHTTVIRECIQADELPPELQQRLPAGKREGEVHYYIVAQRQYGKLKRRADYYTVKHYVEDVHVSELDKSYSEKKLPYRAITWTLPDNANYGNSLVAEYAGDFNAFQQLCQAQTTAGVLASEYRWLKGPSATMDTKDFEDSRNGETVSGEKGDLSIVNIAAEMANAMQAQEVARLPLEKRLARAFVLTSAVIRDSERTTAEEVRALATELDTGLGGGYSRIAVDVQEAFALFLLDIMDVTFRPKDIELTIVTGLDALSRSGDLSNLKDWLAALAGAATIPDPAQRRLKWQVIAQDLGTPMGILAAKYLKSDQEVKQELDEEAQRQAMIRAASAGEPTQPQQGTQPNG